MQDQIQVKLRDHDRNDRPEPINQLLGESHRLPTCKTQKFLAIAKRLNTKATAQELMVVSLHARPLDRDRFLEETDHQGVFKLSAFLFAKVGEINWNDLFNLENDMQAQIKDDGVHGCAVRWDRGPR